MEALENKFSIVFELDGDNFDMEVNLTASDGDDVDEEFPRKIAILLELICSRTLYPEVIAHLERIGSNHPEYADTVHKILTAASGIISSENKSNNNRDCIIDAEKALRGIEFV